MKKYNNLPLFMIVFAVLFITSVTLGTVSAVDTGSDSQAPTVTTNLTSGTYNTTQSVKLTTDDPTSTIYYTTNATKPDTTSTKYTSPITISNSTTMRYAAVDPSGNWSPIYLQNYVIAKSNGNSSSNNNTGQSNSTGPKTNTTEWTQIANGGFVTSGDWRSTVNTEPIGGVTGSIVIGPDGTIYVPTTYALYAFNKDKTLKWIINFDPKYVETEYSTPAIASDGTIYIVGGKLYAVNPNGTIKWTYLIKNELANYNEIIDSPVIGADGIIYIADNSGNIYAVKPNGTLKWTIKITGTTGKPSIGADGTLYFGNNNGVYAINTDGTIKWTYKTTSTQYCSPVIGKDGTIYIGGQNGKLYALNPDGSEKWNYIVKGCISSISISKEGIIYLGANTFIPFTSNGVTYNVSDKGTIYALTDNGNQAVQKWTYIFQNRSIATGGIIGADGIIYIGTAYASQLHYILDYINSEIDVLNVINDSKICAIDSNGILKWTYGINTTAHLGLNPFISCSPTIDANGTLYFGINSDANNIGMVYAISDHVVPNTVTNLRTGKTYTSIQAAINDADTKNGDNLKVTNGTYKENVIVNKKVNILAYGSATIVAADNSKPVFTITNNGSGSTITGFTIKGGWSGVSMISAQNCSITYNTIENYSKYRIYLNNSTASSIIFGWTVLPTVETNTSSGTYNSPQTVKLITTPWNENKIYYTLDGSDPTTSSEVYYDIFGAHISETNKTASSSSIYSKPLIISKTTTLKYMVLNPYYTLSPIYTLNFIIDATNPTASANIKGGLYNTTKTVTLKISENGTIYYTTDGRTPTTASTRYTKPLNITSTTTLKFFAVDAAGNKSSVYTEKYTIDKTSPKKVSVYIKRYASGYSRSGAIAIKFSEKVKSSINWSKVVVKNKYGKTVSIGKSIIRNILYIKTNTKRSSYSYYTVYIPKSAIKDYAGNKFAGYTFRFKTGKY